MRRYLYKHTRQSIWMREWERDWFVCAHVTFFLWHQCTAGGCLVELSLQLVIIMIGKQFINNVQEIVWPKVEAWWQNRKVELSHPTSKDDAKQWEDDYQLVENAGLFQEYLEMGKHLLLYKRERLLKRPSLSPSSFKWKLVYLETVMQFGFITIFVAAFPLAPLFALLNNVVEIRLDAQKFVCSTRRTVGHQAKNIGIWLKILEFLAHLAVISNVSQHVFFFSCHLFLRGFTCMLCACGFRHFS